mmetsp:Transcript_6304/g.18136  ORF Transcript_6304/g.18136 Transcript_6304/m.18136 type:complete len:254 (+) Transcript_6304:201-962(+)
MRPGGASRRPPAPRGRGGVRRGALCAPREADGEGNAQSSARSSTQPRLPRRRHASEGGSGGSEPLRGEDFGRRPLERPQVVEFPQEPQAGQCHEQGPGVRVLRDARVGADPSLQPLGLGVAEQAVPQLHSHPVPVSARQPARGLAGRRVLPVHHDLCEQRLCGGPPPGHQQRRPQHRPRPRRLPRGAVAVLALGPRPAHHAGPRGAAGGGRLHRRRAGPVLGREQHSGARGGGVLRHSLLPRLLQRPRVSALR